MARKYKSPKALTERIADLYTERKALEAAMEAIQKEERALTAQALDLFPEKDITQVVLDSGHKLALGTKPIATVNDWPAVIEDVAKHYDDPLYQGVIHKRVSPTALEKLAFEKKFVPGVVLEHQVTATFSAPRRKRS